MNVLSILVIQGDLMVGWLAGWLSNLLTSWLNDDRSRFDCGRHHNVTLDDKLLRIFVGPCFFSPFFPTIVFLPGLLNTGPSSDST